LMPSQPLKTPSPRDIAAEIVRRVASTNAVTGGGYVVRVSDPPTPQERLQLLAARLQGRSIAIIPHKCKTVREWLEWYPTRRQVKSCLAKDRLRIKAMGFAR
jgi:hypothetical protein